MARLEGLEPPTPWFEARYSIQLSYGRLGLKLLLLVECVLLGNHLLLRLDLAGLNGGVGKITEYAIYT